MIRFARDSGKDRTREVMRMKLLCAATLNLACVSAQAVGNISPVEVVGVFVRESRIDIHLSAPHGNPMNCAIDTELVLLAEEFQNSKTMAAAVLGAHLAEKKISGWVGGCHDGRGKLHAIHVEK